ncbi:MAG: transcriptional repressor [Candidatus Aminicenantes bacterium]|nr:transcriptional repressor [Candidatus Aminicenantes bacterium]
MKEKAEIVDFRAYLRSKKIRFTRSRQLVWKEIHLQPETHRNVADIYQSLKKKGHRVSLATIYRTLNLFVQTGLARAEDFGEKHSHFEPESPGTAHGHLICLDCGLVREFKEEKLSRELEKIGLGFGFKLKKYSLQIFGFCDRCGRSRK